MAFVVSDVEKPPIVTATKTEVRTERLQLFHIAGALGQIPTNAVENLYRSLPVDGAQIGPRFRRPDDGDPAPGSRPRSPVQPELGKDFFMREALTACQGLAGVINGRGGLGGDLFLLSRRESQRAPGVPSPPEGFARRSVSRSSTYPTTRGLPDVLD
jgi:hypothetical protein